MTNRDEALSLMIENQEASLGTIGEDAKPFVSAVGYVCDESVIYILLSDLARHTKNIQKNPAVSLLIVESNSKATIHERKRVTIQGRAEKVNDAALFQKLKHVYLEKFPKATIFFTLPDFRFYRIDIQEFHWIGGFGKAETFRDGSQ